MEEYIVVYRRRASGHECEYKVNAIDAGHAKWLCQQAKSHVDVVSVRLVSAKEEQS